MRKRKPKPNGNRMRLVVGLAALLGALGIGVLVLFQTLNEPLPPPTPTEVVYFPEMYYTPEPPPTPFPINDSCLPGEGYYLDYSVNAPSAYASIPESDTSSPDGRYFFQQTGDAVYLVERTGQGETQYITDFSVPGSLSGFIWWSSDSQRYIFTGGSVPVVYDVESGANYRLDGVTRPVVYAWSPDMHHILFESADYRGLDVWSVESGQKVAQTTGIVQLWQWKPQWSPDGRWLAYVWEDDSAGYSPFPQGISLLAIDGSVEYRHPLGIVSGFNEQLANDDLVWSPDGRRVGLRYYRSTDAGLSEVAAVFGIDGTRQEVEIGPMPVYPSGTLASGAAEVVQSPVNWSPDSASYTFVHAGAADSFEWLAYRPAENRFETLATLYKPPFVSPSGQYAALLTRSDSGLYAVSITDSRGQNPRSLIDGAVDAGDPDWSPDGDRIAVVWAYGQGDQRRVILSWMRPDGSERRELGDAFTDIRDLRWLDGGSRVAYVGWRRGRGNNVEVVDLADSSRKVLVEGLESVNRLEVDPETGELSFWWRTVDGAFGIDGYTPAGERVYHLLAAGEFERPARLFWSPDRQMAALKIGALQYRGLWDEMLVLAYADGRQPLTLRTGLQGLGDPIWSPDGQQLAFTSWPPRQYYTWLEAVDTAGKTQLWMTIYQLGNPVDWFPCP